MTRAVRDENSIAALVVEDVSTGGVLPVTGSDLTNSQPAHVAIVDGDGSQITSFGGGTQYTEGDTDATITGTALMWEDGSNTIRAASAAKPVPVEITDNSNTAAADLDVIKTSTATMTSIGNGVKAVSSAGTAEALAGSTACRKLVVQAQTDNTGYIAVGGSDVDATVATGTGVLLSAGDYIVMSITNLSTVYVDATVNGEGTRFTYWS